MSVNLPAIITRQGGAIEQVVTEIEKYTDSRYPLDARGVFAVGQVVARNPVLNHESFVAVLIDLFAFHGAKSTKEINSLIEEFGVSTVHLVFDYLFEDGKRDHESDEASKPTEWSGEAGVSEICDFVVLLESNHFGISSTDQLDDVIAKLGGLYDACSLNGDELVDALRNADDEYVISDIDD